MIPGLVRKQRKEPRWGRASGPASPMHRPAARRASTRGGRASVLDQRHPVPIEARPCSCAQGPWNEAPPARRPSAAPPGRNGPFPASHPVLDPDTRDRRPEPHPPTWPAETARGNARERQGRRRLIAGRPPPPRELSQGVRRRSEGYPVLLGRWRRRWDAPPLTLSPFPSLLF